MSTSLVDLGRYQAPPQSTSNSPVCLLSGGPRWDGHSLEVDSWFSPTISLSKYTLEGRLSALAFYRQLRQAVSNSYTPRRRSRGQKCREGQMSRVSGTHLGLSYLSVCTWPPCAPFHDQNPSPSTTGRCTKNSSIAWYFTCPTLKGKSNKLHQCH